MSCIVGFSANLWTRGWFVTSDHVVSPTWRTYFWFCDPTRPSSQSLHTENAARERNSWKSINTWKWEQEADDGFICAPRAQTVEPTYVSTSVWSCQPLSLETTSQLGPFLAFINRHIYQSQRTSPTPRKHWDVPLSPAVDLRRSCFLVFSWRAHRSCYFWMLLTEHVVEVYFCELANIITGWASCHVGNKSGSRRMCSLKEIDEMPDYDPGIYKIIFCQKGRSDIYGMTLSWVVSWWKAFCIIRRLHLTTDCKLQALNPGTSLWKHGKHFGNIWSHLHYLSGCGESVCGSVQVKVYTHWCRRCLEPGGLQTEVWGGCWFDCHGGATGPLLRSHIQPAAPEDKKAVWILKQTCSYQFLTFV